MIASGVARFTADIDATVWGDELDLAMLSASLGGQSILPRIEDAVAFARRSRVLLLRHDPTGVPIDVSIAALPFEDESGWLSRSNSPASRFESSDPKISSSIRSSPLGRRT